MQNKPERKSMIMVLCILLLCCFTTGKASAQHSDERLEGLWELKTITITVDDVSQTYSVEELLADKSRLPRNMFTSLYFFDDQIGVNSTETEFVPEVSLKGTFTANEGTLIVTMREEQSRTFNYTFENELLKIEYTQASRQFYLIYKKVEY
ncbi:MAG: hypothetical protein FWH23_03560 [Bacteroidales bacterium]|nr:hypothetical protein [Bacteroidales bacterium]MCL2133382.1 hypothetical protein [Bacteroidales bacterium]